MNNHEKFEQEKKMTRRRFLKLMSGVGLAGTAGTLSGCLVNETSASGSGWLPKQYHKPSNWPSQVKGRVPIDPNSPSITRDDQKCILCGQCLEVCQNVQSVFGYYDLPVKDDFVCVNCGQCTLWCPTGAITFKSEIQKVKEAINDPDKIVMVQTAPSTRVGLGEEFGLPAGSWVQGQQVAALRRLGFDKVFDTLFAADLTIMEEGSELIKRIKEGETLPQFTSCCPGWIKFCEYYYPDLIPNLSTAKSPQQMFGPVLKTYYAKANKIDPKKIFSVSIMPCTAKKFEEARPEFNSAGELIKTKDMRDIDAVLTTRELAEMIKDEGIDLTKLPDEQYDPMMGEGSGAGLIFGNTGGVMEAAVRSAYFLITGKKAPAIAFDLKPVRGLDGIKEAAVNIPGVGDLKVAVVSGLGNARKVMDAVRAGNAPYHFIEIMACPGGCIAGGGQPRTAVPPSDEVRKKRISSMYQKDASYVLRESHENKEILALYENYLGHPLSELSHHLLHTKYTARGKKLAAKKLI